MPSACSNPATVAGAGKGAKIQRLSGITAINLLDKDSLKSTQNLAAVPSSGFPFPPMHRLREFYLRYRQYILTDGLMYIVFLLALAIMFLFFR
jgi:hypothetical protein